MDGQNDFFTWQSLATFAGTATATTAIVNGVSKVWPTIGSAAALGLGVSLVLCLAAAVIHPATGEIVLARPFATYLIAIVNGFFVFASAAGLSAGGAAIVHGNTKNTATPRGADGAPNSPSPAPRFWQIWF